MKNRFAFSSFRNGQTVAEHEIPVAPEISLFLDSIAEQCREGRRLANFFGRCADGEILKLYAILSDDKANLLWIGATAVGTSFPSLTPRCPQAHLFEREIFEQFGCRPQGHPWLKPVRFPARPQSPPIPRDYPFFRMDGDEVHEVAVGPVHAGIIEPGHFRFQCHGENVFHLEIQLGYQHRGAEKSLENAVPARLPFIAESIAGDTAVGHGLASAMALESLSGTRVSARAEALRAIALELERLANHVGDLGALGADIGFVPGSAYFGRLRGEFLNMLMEFTGNRYGRCFVRPGGVTDDLPKTMAESFLKRMKRAQKELRKVSDLFFDTPSVFERLDGVGTVSSDACRELGLVGPAARACGQDLDVRKDHPYGVYRFHHVPTMTADEGDVFARASVRRLEIERSLEFLISLIGNLPQGNLRVPCAPFLKRSLTTVLVEGWRGEIVHTVITDEEGRISRYKIKDPSFHNWMGLAMALRDQQISDFPLINKSFNLSYAGHDL
ncbi:MAG: NADH-quinone oxidoreductase subunit C [Candidatus Omnitrophica bacterium]|nr:NADH-quinone oxidoreductase subunit C [Candidatus Omnitrophota bacterium]